MPEVAARPYDPEQPVPGCAEAGKQRVAGGPPPLPPAPGRPRRLDHGPERRGTADLLMVFEPSAGKRGRP